MTFLVDCGLLDKDFNKPLSPNHQLIIQTIWEPVWLIKRNWLQIPLKFILTFLNI